MDKFKLGDQIRVVSDFDAWLVQDSTRDQIFTVVEDNSSNHVFCPDTNTADLIYLNDWPNDFELVHRPTAFSLDYVPERPEEIIAIKLDNITTGNILSESSTGPSMMFKSPHMGAVIDPTFTTLPYPVPDKPDLGVYRPDVVTRKADKIRIELFDDGFPNAILEIAKVLTWAQKVKGYKDHDWVNLPDAENSLKGAASRHRRDANQQKMEGVPAKDRVDHESKHHHLAHQAFNILAELELILTGKIK